MSQLYKKIGLAVFLLIAFFCRATFVDAATLFISPSQSEVTAGNIVSLKVSVNTQGKVTNNAESILQFPSDLLEVVSLDTRSSIFTLWVEEPSFSNTLGQVTFNGGVPNPGFIGDNGSIISVVFRAKKAGSASVILSNAAVRENDGLGTDILSNRVGAEINILSSQKPPVIEPDVDFVVTSSSHPNQNNWYDSDTVDLSWTLPKNVEAVKTLLGAYRNSEPTVYYAPAITTRRIEDVGDGIWYFHVNYFASGVWSRTQHYKLQIDTGNPTNLSVRSEQDSDGKVTLYLKAEDSLSGIDRYQVLVNNDKPLNVKSDANGEAVVELPLYQSGVHQVIVTAFDKAGNTIQTEETVSTDTVLELKIDSYSATIRANESIEISGTTPYPYAQVQISIRDDAGLIQTHTVKSNSYSTFSFISQPISKDGKYTAWADILKENGDVRLSSQKITIAVKTPLLLQIGSYTIGLMKVLIPAILLLFLFLFILLYGWHKFFAFYRKVKKESREAEKVLGKSFDLLRKDLVDHISKLRKIESKRKLTPEEIDFLERFKEELSEAEDLIEKEIKDISED